MTALARDRIAPERAGLDFVCQVAANAKIYAGALVVLGATGYAAPGSTAAGLKAAGVAQENVDNTGGADGAKTVKVRAGLFKFVNDGTITAAHVGRFVHIVDDQTLSLTDNSAARSPAGVLWAVDPDGVWVFVDVRRNITVFANIDFANMAAAASNDQNVAVPGAELGDSVSLGLPAAPTAGIVFQAFVSLANQVTVRATNITAGAVDPAAANYRVTVVKG